ELGNVLLAKNRPGEAVGFYRSALVTRPESGAVYNSLGLALLAQGHVDEALDAFRKSVELDPAGTAAHPNLDPALPPHRPPAPAPGTKRGTERARVRGGRAHDRAPRGWPSGQSNRAK